MRQTDSAEHQSRIGVSSHHMGNEPETQGDAALPRMRLKVPGKALMLGASTQPSRHVSARSGRSTEPDGLERLEGTG